MTIYILGGATAILLALILWRGLSPNFKRKSEHPKHQILSNLGLDPQPEDGAKSPNSPIQPSAQKGTDEKPQP